MSLFYFKKIFVIYLVLALRFFPLLCLLLSHPIVAAPISTGQQMYVYISWRFMFYHPHLLYVLGLHCAYMCR